jgi:hypothetical protein
LRLFVAARELATSRGCATQCGNSITEKATAQLMLSTGFPGFHLSTAQYRYGFVTQGKPTLGSESMPYPVRAALYKLTRKKEVAIMSAEAFEYSIQKPAQQQASDNQDPFKDYRGGIGDKFSQYTPNNQMEGAQQAAGQSQEVKKMLGEFQIEDNGKSHIDTVGNKRGYTGP